MRKILFVVGVIMAALFAGVATGPTAFADEGRVPDWNLLRVYADTHQMRPYFDLTVQMVDQVTRENGYSTQLNWVFVPAGTSIDIPACKQAQVPSEALYEYCPFDKTIYVGGGMMEQLLAHHWMMPAEAMFHESGHARQDEKGLFNLVSGDNAQAVVIGAEKQADCWAGVMSAWSLPMTGLTLGDAPGIMSGFAAIGDVAPPEMKTHGDSFERVGSLGSGFIGGFTSHSPAACDSIGFAPVS